MALYLVAALLYPALAMVAVPAVDLPSMRNAQTEPSLPTSNKMGGA
jgi:hypothetical protein